MAEALSPRTDALDVIVELLGALDGATQSGREFYDRLCEACCRLGAMERALLLLYDDARQLVVVVGGHGVDAGLLQELYGTLEETPDRPGGAVRGPRRRGDRRARALGARALRARSAAWRRSAASRCPPPAAGSA